MTASLEKNCIFIVKLHQQVTTKLTIDTKHKSSLIAIRHGYDDARTSKITAI